MIIVTQVTRSFSLRLSISVSLGSRDKESAATHFVYCFRSDVSGRLRKKRKKKKKEKKKEYEGISFSSYVEVTVTDVRLHYMFVLYTLRSSESRDVLRMTMSYHF